MTARVAINGPSRIARSTLTDHAFDAAGFVSAITRKTIEAEADDILRQEAAPGRYQGGLVMAGYDNEWGGAQQTVRQTPAALGEAAPSR
ncbi:hypothetical protein SNOUR_02550 [Streptomyces noursei ATCC 11455]|uniref:hypothetical protein n=1 Tax=Streptomyces noursei TaxID=1971 RepID=UPI00081C878C|nr:hypothetical protein SNOUR_02550 [Streptomyces noursei ATCC 11455]